MSAIRQIFEHSVDVELLPSVPIVLDAGASDLPWTKALLTERPAARVIALEPNMDFKHIDSRCEVYPVALVGENPGTINYAKFSVPIRNFVTPNTHEYFRNENAVVVKVPSVTIQQLMATCNVNYWDVVKLDIEGAEFAVLENWPGPIATQITVEFHDFKDRKKWDAAYFNSLSGYLYSLGYYTVQNELTNFGTEESAGHWDSLFVLRPGFRK